MLPRHISPSPATPRRTPVVRIALLVVSLLLGLTAGAVVQAGPAGAAVPKRSDVEKHIDWAIFRLLNAERALHGLRPLSMAPGLRLSARRHNVTMARFNEMSHQLPGEPVFTTRMS